MSSPTMRAITTLAVLLLAATPAVAAEICGNGVDDDGDGVADEGCYPGLTTVCESPLSCDETGLISPSTGSLRYALPPDIAPASPYGLNIGLRRFYTSQSATPKSAQRKPMGDHWNHTYMTWLDSGSGGGPTTMMLHTSRGQDVQLAKTSSDATWEYFTPQPGFHYATIRRRLVAPNETQIRQLTGETAVYDTTGRLTEIWDTLASPNKILLTYNANDQVLTVTDATAKRRLLFNYASGLLSSVNFQLLISSAWTTQHTTTYGYTSGVLMTATIGGQLAQTNVYTSGYLTQIQDGGGKTIVGFAYSTAIAGRVQRVDSTHGTLGFDFNSTRTNCSGNTALYFNKGSATSCTTDTDCGAGLLCGGNTGTGATGTCFRGARCLGISSPSEDVVTAVTSIGPPGETCDGACLDVAEYIWDTASNKLDLQATQDPAGNYVSQARNANGLPTHVSYGDADNTADPGTALRDVYYFYDASFPGKVTEIRRPSDLDSNRLLCNGTSTTGCARTLFTYNTNGQLATMTSSGTTLGTTGTAAAFSHVTTYTHDTKGRLTLVDGGKPGANDVTAFDYWSSTDPLKDGFLQNYKQKKAATYLTMQATAYDFFGHASAVLDIDGTLSCQTFDAARGYLSTRREAMAGQTSCTANKADLVTTYVRDSALRLTQVTRPDNSCMFYEYDTQGRLAVTRRRDDCNAASGGDRQEFTYDYDGLLTKTETFDASSTVTQRHELTYFDSRRLEKSINPVAPTKWTGLTYDVRGLLSEVAAPDSLGKVTYTNNADKRVTAVNRYRTTTAFDTWNLLYAWLGEQAKVTDGDSKANESVRDDKGRIVKEISADLDYPNINTYNETDELYNRVESLGGTTPWTTTYTYDDLGRRLTENGPKYCAGFASVPEFKWVYDAPPVTCPYGAGCTNTAGRLAYVKAFITCDPMKSDGAIDQETFYSYDAAGRVVSEYIRDDTGRVGALAYEWTKNGQLLRVVNPSGSITTWTYDSTSSNSDSDRITAVSQAFSGSPVVDNVQWYPYGPLKQFNQMNKSSSIALRTRISRNLAYRITDTRVETQTGSTMLQGVAITEDTKGRVTSRGYTPNTNGVADSYFLYDGEDRLLCETTTSVSTCPTTGGTTVKNSFTASPPFTNAGDWTQLMRPIPGSSGYQNDFNPSGYGTSHRVTVVRQNTGSPAYGDTSYYYDERGRRTADDNTTTLTHDRRDYTYDGRGNVKTVRGQLYNSTALAWQYYDSTSYFDAEERRMSKTLFNETSKVTAQWFYYYDPLGRITELKYTPNTASPTTNQVFQLYWLGDRLIAYMQNDLPSGTSTRRYVGTDETGRPLDMWTWPASGDSTQVWAVAPSAWGGNTPSLGGGIFQPIQFAGQYIDDETIAPSNVTYISHRPALALNGHRTYDPFTGGYLQPDPLAFRTWSSYVYADSNPAMKQDPSGLRILGGGGALDCDDAPANLGCSQPRSSNGAFDDGGGGEAGWPGWNDDPHGSDGDDRWEICETAFEVCRAFRCSAPYSVTTHDCSGSSPTFVCERGDDWWECPISTATGTVYLDCTDSTVTHGSYWDYGFCLGECANEFAKCVSSGGPS